MTLRPKSRTKTVIRPVPPIKLVQAGSVNIARAKGRKVPLPGVVVGLHDEIVKNWRAGKAVSAVPEHQQRTSQCAANLLRASWPFIIWLPVLGKMRKSGVNAANKRLRTTPGVSRTLAYDGENRVEEAVYDDE